MYVLAIFLVSPSTRGGPFCRFLTLQSLTAFGCEDLFLSERAFDEVAGPSVKTSELQGHLTDAIEWYFQVAPCWTCAAGLVSVHRIPSSVEMGVPIFSSLAEIQAPGWHCRRLPRQ
jgi:hypothetical protein